MANNEPYILGIGFDAGDVFKGFKEMKDDVVSLEKVSTDAGKNMKEALSGAGKASDDLSVKLKKDADAALILRNAARDLGKDLGSALQMKGKGKEVEDLFAKVQAQIVKLQGNSKINIDVLFNNASIKAIGDIAQASGAEIQFLNSVLADAKKNLDTLDPNSQEFAELNQQIQLTEGLMEGLAAAEKGAETGAKSLKAQLRELKAELAVMEEAGQGGTEQFIEMSIRAGELEDQIGDVAARVRVLASDTKYLDAGIQAVTALAGGFAVAQGAAALFGTENEKVNEALKKVTAAMAILQGIQAIANALNKDSALSVLFFSRAQAAQVVTTEAVAVATVAETAATEGATVATATWTATLLANPFIAIAVAIAALVAGILIYISASDDAAKSAKDFNEELELQNALLSTNENEIRRRTALLVAQAKAQGKSAEEIKNIEGKGLSERLELQKKYNSDTQKLLEQELSSENVTLEESQKTADALMAGKEKQSEIENQIEIEKYEAQAEANKKRTEDGKKFTEQSKKDAEEQKKTAEQLLNFTKAYQNAQIAAMKDGFAKQRKQAQIQADQQIADLNKEKALSVEAGKVRNNAIAEIRKALGNELKQIDEDENQAIFNRQLAAAQQLTEMRKDSLDKDLAALELEKIAKEAQINEDFKDEETLRLSLLERLGEETDRKRKETILKGRDTQLQEQEETEILTAELLAGYATKPAEIEEAKQQEILRIQIKYAKERLNALTDSGAQEGDLAVLQAKSVIAKLEQTLKDSGDNKRITMFSLLGLDGTLTDKEQQAIADGINGVKVAFKQFTDGLLADNQRVIDSREENIESIEDEIDELKDQLDQEKEYADEGLASKAEQVQAEIDLKEKQKNEEIRQRNEAFEKQKQLQKAQLIADGISQASSLITASANIIEGFSTIPVIGPALGAIAVGAMIAGFIYSKASAFAAVNAQQPTKFEDGGWIGGERHYSGGSKFFAQDGSGVELERDEFVVNRNAAAKSGSLLEAINNDSISQMSDEGLRRILAESGIHLSSDDAEAGVMEGRQYEANSMNFVGMGIEELKAIEEGIAFLAQSEKSKVTTWEDDDYYYSKRGNVTTRKEKKR